VTKLQATSNPRIIAAVVRRLGKGDVMSLSNVRARSCISHQAAMDADRPLSRRAQKAWQARLLVDERM